MGKKQKIPAEQREAMAAQAEQMKMLKELPLPELQELVLKNPELVGLLEAEELGPSALEDVQTDPRLAETQMQALQSIKERAEQGLTSEDKLAMEQMLGQADAAAKSRQQGLMQEMARRGTLDSGASLAASLAGQQSTASNARQQAMQMAAQSSANRLQAAQQMGSMAGQMEQADFGRQANLASAKDRIAQANAATRMQTSQQNLAARQAIENQKAALGNQATMYNISRDQQQFNNQLAKHGASQSAINAYAQMTSQVPQRGGTGQMLGTLAGAAIGGAKGGWKGAQVGAKAGGSAGGLLDNLFKDGGVVRAEDGDLMYRPQNTEIQVPAIFQNNQTPAMLTPPPVSEPEVKVPSGLDIFSRKLTDTELKNTFSPQRSEYVTKEKETADIPYRKEFGGLGGSGEKVVGNDVSKKSAPAKKEKGMSDEELSAIEDIAESLGSQQKTKQPELNLNTNVQFAQPENVLAKSMQPAQQFANPFAAQDGGTYYNAEDGDLMYKSDNDGDIVQGDSFAGDRVDAKLNSGEMVLNVSQQQRLMDLLRGKADIEDLGDKDIVEGVPRDYQEKLKAKAKYEDGGKVLSPEELAMYQQIEEEMDDEAMSNQEAKSPNLQTKKESEPAFEGYQKLQDFQNSDEGIRRQQYFDDQRLENMESKATKIEPKMEAKEEVPKKFDINSKYESLLKEYERISNEKPKSNTMKNWATFADIMDRAAANYNPYYKSFNNNLVDSIEKSEQSAKKQKLSQLTTMMDLLNKMQGREPSSKKDKYMPSEGEKVLDREFAKEYNKWQTGGKADFVENKKIFDEAISALKKGKVSTGSLSGLGARTPLVRTDTRELESRVRKAINNMLKATLGAQFTEKEGERIFEQTFDPFASEETNIKNMQTELSKIENRAKFLEDQGKYFRKNKTLSGYEPEVSTVDGKEINEVERKTSDGRIAIFDAKTKKFLRYK